MLYHFVGSQFYLQRSNYTVPFSKLKKTDPKAQQLGVCQGTLRNNRTATRHRPVTQTANAADAPIALCKMARSRGSFGYKEQAEPVDEVQKWQGLIFEAQ